MPLQNVLCSQSSCMHACQVDAAWKYLEQTKNLEGAAVEAVYEIKARRSDASVSGERISLYCCKGMFQSRRSKTGLPCHKLCGWPWELHATS